MANNVTLLTLKTSRVEYFFFRQSFNFLIFMTEEKKDSLLIALEIHRELKILSLFSLQDVIKTFCAIKSCLKRRSFAVQAPPGIIVRNKIETNSFEIRHSLCVCVFLMDTNNFFLYT